MPVGRPTDLTPEAVAEVAYLLPRVLHLGLVADFIGVHRSTVYRWLERGRREERRLRRPTAKPKSSEAIFHEFCGAHKKGLAEGEIRAVAAIRRAAAESWQAAAWLLERRYPGRWGRDRVLLLDLLKKVKALRDERPGSTAKRQSPHGPGEGL